MKSIAGINSSYSHEGMKISIVMLLSNYHVPDMLPSRILFSPMITLYLVLAIFNGAFIMASLLFLSTAHPSYEYPDPPTHLSSFSLPSCLCCPLLTSFHSKTNLALLRIRLPLHAPSTHLGSFPC